MMDIERAEEYRKSLKQKLIDEDEFERLEMFKEAEDFLKKSLKVDDDEFDPEQPQEHTDLWNELCEKAEQFLKESE